MTITGCLSHPLFYRSQQLQYAMCIKWTNALCCTIIAKGFVLATVHSSSHKMNRCLLPYVVLVERHALLQLLAKDYETLLSGWNSCRTIVNACADDHKNLSPSLSSISFFSSSTVSLYGSTSMVIVRPSNDLTKICTVSPRCGSASTLYD